MDQTDQSQVLENDNRLERRKKVELGPVNEDETTTKDKAQNGGCVSENGPEKNNLRSKNKAKFNNYIAALRPWSFSASLIPVMLGTVLCWKEIGKFSFILSILGGLVVIFVHAAGNLVNTYYDFLRGMDNKSSDDKTLVDHILTPEEVVHAGVGSYILGCLSFMVLLFLTEARLEHLALLFFSGLSGSFFYTGSVGLKYYGLGDIVIIFAFGPVSVLFAYTAQCGHFSWYPLLCAVPLVLNTEAILHSNNTRDMDSDKKAGAITLALILGRKLSYLLYFILVFTPYIISFVLAIKFSNSFGLPLLTLSMALRLEKDFRRGNLAKLPRDTAKLNLLYGFLYVLGFLLGR